MTEVGTRPSDKSKFRLRGPLSQINLNHGEKLVLQPPFLFLPRFTCLTTERLSRGKLEGRIYPIGFHFPLTREPQDEFREVFDGFRAFVYPLETFTVRERVKPLEGGDKKRVFQLIGRAGTSRGKPKEPLLRFFGNGQTL